MVSSSSPARAYKRVKRYHEIPLVRRDGAIGAAKAGSGVEKSLRHAPPVTAPACV